ARRVNGLGRTATRSRPRQSSWVARSSRNGGNSTQRPGCMVIPLSLKFSSQSAIWNPRRKPRTYPAADRELRGSGQADRLQDRHRGTRVGRELAREGSEHDIRGVLIRLLAVRARRGGKAQVVRSGGEVVEVEVVVVVGTAPYDAVWQSRTASDFSRDIPT